jgi:quercetin dioxygenase-like cupin family protein
MKSKTTGKPGALPHDVLDLINYQADAIVSREIVKGETGTVTVLAFDAGQGLSEHAAPFDALAQVLDGQAEITVAGKDHTVRAGQLLERPRRRANEPVSQLPSFF